MTHPKLAVGGAPVLLLALLVAAPSPALATAQEHEVLWIDGEELSVMENPLAPWLESNPGAIPFYGVTSTARWRGYLGEWEGQRPTGGDR